MYYLRVTYIFVILLGLIKFSSEDCRSIDTYGNYCTDRNFDNSCRNFGYNPVDLWHCSELFNLEYVANNLYHRRFIEVVNSHLDGIPGRRFQSFSSLENLTIFNSGVHNLEVGAFIGLSNIYYLNISHNSIQRIARGVFNFMLTLETLDLSRNRIKFEDNKIFTGMKNLKELYLNDNIISNMAILADSVMLTTLDISNNQINKLDFLVDCSNIKYLNVSGNNVEFVNSSIFNGLYRLESLDISKNMFRFFNNDTFGRMENLKELYLNDNQILDMPSLASCLKLSVLDISNNKINDLLDLLQNLSNLKKLNLARNLLFNETDMPVHYFRNVPHLESLNLSCTSIKRLSVGSFSGLSNLEMLDLSENNLTYLKEGIFHDLTSLRRLYINDNRLSHFEYDGFSNLHEISLAGNIWNCLKLSVITKRLSGVRIVRGTAYNTTNLFGIPCYEETKDSQRFLEYNASNLNGLDKEYLSYIIKSQSDVNRALAELGIALNQTIFNLSERRESKLDEIFEDFKHFLNESNSHQNDYLEHYWKTLETYQSSLQNPNLNYEETIRAIANAIGSVQNRTESDIKQIILDLKSVLVQKDSTQRSYSTDNWSKLNAAQDSIQQSLMDIKNILSSTKTISQPLRADTAKYVTDTEKIKIQENSSLGRSAIIPLYCLLIVLCAMLALSLSKQFRKIRRSRRDHIECNSLNTLQV